MSSVRVDARLDQRRVEFDLALDDGQVLAVLGPNGAGKSTLMLMLAGLLRPDHGRIELGPTVVSDAADGTFVPAHARGVAMLTQQARLFPHLSVAANVAYGPRCAGQSRSASRAIARHWLDAVDAAHLADRRPAQLSGGQAQRVALARALAADPQVLLLDEPMSALDVTAAPGVRRLLREVLRGRTAMIVTHDLLDALAIADAVAVVDGGRVVETGPVRQVLTSPRSEFAARIAGLNLVAGTIGEPGRLRTDWEFEVFGTGEVQPGTAAIALFRPGAVAVHPDPPHGSPRNVVAVTIAELDVRGPIVRVRGIDQPDGTAGLAADITTSAAADLDLVPGKTVYFAVKAQEVELHAALPAIP
ncbi:MAG: ATP-binding cassette domain-containing protein [Actinomycetia bacterium]|nr:ATP-binding cassette domain-containing protein [Actinomycetes bacterium]